MRRKTKMRLFERAAAIFLILILLLGLVPVNVHASEAGILEKEKLETEENLEPEDEPLENEEGTEEPPEEGESGVVVRWEIIEPGTAELLVDPEKEAYASGEEVFFSASPAEGFELERISVLFGEAELELKEEQQGAYRFVIPDFTEAPQEEIVVTISTRAEFPGYLLESQGAGCTIELPKDRVKPGQEVEAVITPADGKVVPPDRITVLAKKEEENLQKVDFSLIQTSEDGLTHTILFTVPELGKEEAIRILVDAEGLDRYTIRKVTAESDNASEDLFDSVDISQKALYEGAFVTITGIPEIYGEAAAVPYGEDSPVIPLIKTEQGYTFVMPGYDVEILCEELDLPIVMDPEDVYTPDTDFEYEHKSQIPNEPSMEVKKSAAWTNIQAGEALLTIGEYDLNQYTNIPCDYIIMVDCSATMSTRDNGLASTRYELANQAIRELLERIQQDNNTLSADMKSRVAFMTYSGSGDNGRHPTSAQYESDYYAASGDIYGEGNHDYFLSGVYEYAGFTTDMDSIRSMLNLNIRRGSKINLALDRAIGLLQAKGESKRRTKVINVSDCGNGWYGQMREGYFSGNLITDWLGVHNDRGVTAEDKVRAIKQDYGAQFMQICIGPSEDPGNISRTSVSEATGDHLFWTYDGTPGRFDEIFTQIHDIPFEVSASGKQIVDLIDTEYWEIEGVVSCSTGRNTASLDGNKLVWKLPDGTAEQPQTCTVALKLKDKYRYKSVSDTVYPTNADGKNPGLTYSYTISGGIYDGESRKGEVKTPVLKYGTVEFSGTKIWTVSGSSSLKLDTVLRQKLPGLEETAIERKRLEAPNWSCAYTNAERKAAGKYPYVKYNNLGQMVSYRITETVPEGYTEKPSLTERGGAVGVRLYNEPYKIKARVAKQDEETGNLLSGAVFQVYQWSVEEARYVPYLGTTSGLVPGTDYEAGNMNGSSSIVELKESSRGIYETPGWLYYTPDNGGRFAIVEAKAPHGYFGDWKRDDLVTEESSDEDKIFHEIAISMDGSNNEELLSFSGEEDFSYGNERVLGQLSFQKKDREAKSFLAQGDATLEGAAYRLYALEDIVHADGSSGVLYHAGEEIPLRQAAKGNETNIYVRAGKGEAGGSAAVIPEGGRVILKDLELGAYYLKEVTASQGYLKDARKYEFRLSYAGEHKKTVKQILSDGVYEQVKKQKLSFYKMTGFDTQDQIVPMKGAGFSVYLVSALEGGKYAAYTDEQLVQAMIDDYRDPETLLYERVKQFSPAIVFEEPDSVDVTSGKLVKEVCYRTGETHSIKQENGYLVSEISSDEKGIVTLPSMPYGRYVVIETATPKGKTATRPFVFTVAADDQHGETDSEADKDGKPLEDLVLLVDRPVSAFIRLLKVDAKSLKPVLKPGAKYVIHDTEGVWFDYAMQEKTSAEKKAYRDKYGDLVVQYSQGAYAGSREEPYTTREVPSASRIEKSVYIDTAQTLPAGVYELEEIAAPEGYVLQGKEGVIRKKRFRQPNQTFFETREEGRWENTPSGRVKFQISSEYAVYDPAVGNFVMEVRQANDPVIGKISIYAEGQRLRGASRDGALIETGLGKYRNYRFLYELAPAEGAEFKIYAAEDIYSPEYDERARMRLEEAGRPVDPLFRAGEEVLSLVTDKNGQAWTGREDWPETGEAKGLPIGKYHVVQTKAGAGCVLTEENRRPRAVSIDYEGQEVPVVYRDEAYENPRQKIQIEASKLDQDTRELLPGAVFGLYAGENIKTASGESAVIKGDLVAVAETFRDDSGKVQNAVFDVELPSAKYIVRELKAPAGYLLQEKEQEADASFVPGKEKLHIQKEFCNESTRVTITKLDAVDGKGVPGALVGIFDEKGQKAAEAETGADGQAVFRGLSAGTYTFRELAAPSGYALNPEPGTFTIAGDGSVSGAVSFQDEQVRIRIKKVDEQGKPLEGAEFTLYEQGGSALEAKTSASDGSLEFQKLSPGKYVIRETRPPAGYQLSQEELQVEVTPEYRNTEPYEFKNEKNPSEKPKHSSSREEPGEAAALAEAVPAANTGDPSAPALAAALLLPGIGGICFAIHRIKKFSRKR